MLKRFLRTAAAPVLLFALAAGLIGYGGIRSVQAAPRIQSNWYGAEVVLTNIETAIVENGLVVEGDETLLHESFCQPNGIDPDTAAGFVVGKTYDEVLSVRNVGTIPQYVRVSVYRWWTDAQGHPITQPEDQITSGGNKTSDALRGLRPDYIDLRFIEGNGWAIDHEASTPERTVLYYTNPNSADGSLAVGEDSTPFVDKLTILPGTLTAMEADGTYLYDGVQFHIKATVDAVQTHNGQLAMTGAWGRTN